ncbi:MAG: PadR family transcriptional regulator [Pseudomonadota bacterium]
MSLSKELARGTVTPIVLSLLAERPMYGYEIVKTVNQRSNGVLAFKEGTLYPLLHQLQGRRLLRAKWEDGPAGKPRKYYALTPKGERLLAKSRAEWSSISGAVNALLMGETA